VLDIDDDIGPTRKEGESYLSTPRIISADTFDVLQWWKENEGTYPRLAQVAKDILAVQIAQVGVERVFNVSKDVIGDQRHNLSAHTVREIMVLRHWISGGQPTASSTDTELPPCDEVDDLFELPAPIDQSGGSTRFRDGDDIDDEPVTPSRREQRSRKRMRPERYRTPE
jgi:hypothetical protein